jgi:uncharacterized protein (TIGR03437 family)
MQSLLLVVALIAPVLSVAADTPFIFRAGVVNAAAFTVNSLPGGGIAQGSIFTIFGRFLGPATPSQVSSFPLNRQFAGVSINLRKGATQLSAIPLFVLNSQINAILPSTTPLGDVSLQVSFNGQNSNWVPVRVVAHAPAIFTATGLGRGWAIFQNFVSAANQPLNSGTTAVTPGQAGTLWLTGTGAVNAADGETPPVGDLPYIVEIFIGGRPVTRKLYAGRAPAISGLDQYVFYIPDDAPTGCFVPVYVRVNGAVSNATTMAIMPQGGACSDAHNPIAAALVKGGKIVHGLLYRAALSAGQFAGIDLAVSVDKAAVRAMEESGGQFAFDPFLATPPQGACTSYSLSGNIMASGTQMSSGGKALDLGTLSANSAGRDVPLTSLQAGLFSSILGGTYPTAAPPFLSSGTPSLRASGGADARSFDVPIPASANLAGGDLQALTEINRASASNISWTAQAGVSALVVGGVYDQATNSSGLFLCVSAAGASSLRVPDYVLANLPARRDISDKGDARLFFSALPVLRETATADQIRIFSGRQDLTVQAIRSVR